VGALGPAPWAPPKSGAGYFIQLFISKPTEVLKKTL